MGGDDASPQSDDANLEHDRGHDARRSGRAGKVCGLCDGDTWAGALRARSIGVVLAAMQASFDPREVWGRIEWAAVGTSRAAARGQIVEIR
jgi:hypothetical protein